MVLTRDELVAALQTEVRILLHLAGKIDSRSADYRPTAGQRSAAELVKYLSMMGPEIIEVARQGVFDGAAWGAAEERAMALSLDAAVEAIAGHHALYESELASMSDADLRAEIAAFGEPTSRGAFLVRWLLGGCAAYRTQLFLYLKASGLTELGTSNLWSGADPAPAA